MKEFVKFWALDLTATAQNNMAYWELISTFEKHKQAIFTIELAKLVKD